MSLKDRIPFFRLPLEVQHQAIGYLDGKSTANAAASTRSMRVAATGHPSYEATIRAGQLAKRLGSLLPDPAFRPDDATVNELRECSAFLTKEEVTEILKSALHEGEYGRNKTRLIGAALSGHPEMAQEVADDTSQLQTRYARGVPQEQADRWEHSHVVADILGSIGNGAKDSAYTPFVELMQSGDCNADEDIAHKMAQSLPNLPMRVGDAVASFVLAQEPAGEPDEPSYKHTLQLFFHLTHVSPPVQEAVFLKAQATYRDISSSDDREFMADEFSVEREFSDFAGARLPDESKNKWGHICKQFVRER